MFSLQRAKPTDLLTSKLYNESTFYPRFLKDLKVASSEVLIESPFLTVGRTKKLTKTFKQLSKRGVSVRINTRESKHHTPELKLQSERSIELLKESGVRVFLCSDYRHRKLAIMDGTVLWEGSLNILSQNNSVEIMRRTESREVAQQMIRFTKVRNKYW